MRSAKRSCSLLSLSSSESLPLERAEFNMLRAAAIVTQSHVRMKYAQALSCKRQRAICTIQSVMRMKLTQMWIQKMNIAATKIARQWRICHELRIRTRAAIIIQSSVRRWLQQLAYENARKKVIWLQSTVKACPPPLLSVLALPFLLFVSSKILDLTPSSSPTRCNNIDADFALFETAVCLSNKRIASTY